MAKGKRKDKKRPLSLGDRLITAALGFVIVLVIGSIVWWFVALRLARRNYEPVPYWIVIIVAAVVGVIGFFVGPEKMMDIIEGRRRSRDD